MNIKQYLPYYTQKAVGFALVGVALFDVIYSIKTGFHLYEHLGLRDFMTSDFCKTWFKSVEVGSESLISYSLDAILGITGFAVLSQSGLDKHQIELEKVCKEYENITKINSPDR